MVKIFEKFRFKSNFRQKIRLESNFRKISILVKFSKYFDFFEKFEKLSISIGQNFRKSSILMKFSKKFRFWSKFSKISTSVKFSQKFRFWSNFRKRWILVKFSKNFDFFYREVGKISILVKFSNSSNLVKFFVISILAHFSKKKIRILVKIPENFQKFRF